MKRMTYKTGWEWWLNYDLRDDVLEARIQFRAPDVKERHEADPTIVPITTRFPVDISWDEELCREELAHQIMLLERHETNEWLRYDDVPLVEPH
jgi:hypothetical protein